VLGILFYFSLSCHLSSSIFLTQKEVAEGLVQYLAAGFLHLASWATQRSTLTCLALMNLSGIISAAIPGLHCSAVSLNLYIINIFYFEIYNHFKIIIYMLISILYKMNALFISFTIPPGEDARTVSPKIRLIDEKKPSTAHRLPYLCICFQPL
jgi:hypothetical protein